MALPDSSSTKINGLTVLTGDIVFTILAALEITGGTCNW